MNKFAITFFTLLLSALFILPTHAQKQGGFSGAEAEKATIRQAKNLSTKSIVLIQGYIKKKIGKTTYNFTDKDDTITIHVSDKLIQRQLITPDNLIEVIGETDKDWGDTEINIDDIRIVPEPEPESVADDNKDDTESKGGDKEITSKNDHTNKDPKENSDISQNQPPATEKNIDNKDNSASSQEQKTKTENKFKPAVQIK